MSEDSSLYYNYTNKGTTYQFDLSKLTPEERLTFQKLNDRQKRRFITLKDMEEPGKMKNEIALRPNYVDDMENERENNLRTITHKIELINNYQNDKKDNSKKSLNDIKDELLNYTNHEITENELNKVIRLNNYATIGTLIKYYNNLLSDLKSDANTAKMKKVEASLALSKNITTAKPENIEKLLKEIYEGLLNPISQALVDKIKKRFNISFNGDVDNYIKQLTDVGADKLADKVKKEIETKQEIIDETFVNNANDIKIDHERATLLRQLENMINEYAVMYDNQFGKIRKIPGVSTLSKNQMDELDKIYNQINNIDTDNGIRLSPEERKKNIRLFIKSLLNSYGLDNNIYKLQNTLEKNGYDDSKKWIEDIFRIGFTEGNAQVELGNLLTTLKLKDKKYLDGKVSQYAQEILNAIMGVGQILETFDTKYKGYSPLTDDYINYLGKKSQDLESGSIRDKIRKIFRGNTEEDIKKISETQAQQHNQTQGDIQSLKDRVNSLEQEVKNLQTKQFQQPQPQPPSQPQTKPSFLNDIKNPVKQLKPTEPSPKLPEPTDDSLTSQFKKIMEERRKDIEPDEVEESDDEEWLASGVSRMPLSDFLMNL